MRPLNGIRRRAAKAIDSALCRNHFRFYDVGFHGDANLVALVQDLASLSDLYVETGASVGASLDHVARAFPRLECLGCEPDPDYFRHLKRRTETRPNARVFMQDSTAFLRDVLSDPRYWRRETVFWLDAHGHGFRWPIRDEISFVLANWSRAYVLIDDFRVPGNDRFGYDRYDDQLLGLPLISDLLEKRRDWRAYFPSYDYNSSAYHPMRGWVLIDVGHESLPSLSMFLRDKVIPYRGA